MILYEKEFEFDKSFDNQIKSLYGISYTRTNCIRAKIGLKKFIKLEEIIEFIKLDLGLTIQDIVSKKYIIENLLKHQNNLKRKDLKLVGNYKSLRFSQGLPANGQRTHTNAKTQKKKK